MKIDREGWMLLQITNETSLWFSDCEAHRLNRLEVIKLFSVLKKFLKYMAHYFNTVKLNITFLQKSLLMFTFVYLKINLEV